MFEKKKIKQADGMSKKQLRINPPKLIKKKKRKTINLKRSGKPMIDHHHSHNINIRITVSIIFNHNTRNKTDRVF